MYGDICFRTIYFPFDRIQEFQCLYDKGDTFTRGSVLGTGKYKTLLREKAFEITASCDGICIEAHEAISFDNYDDYKAGESTSAITYIESSHWEYFSSKMAEHDDLMKKVTTAKSDTKDFVEKLHCLETAHQKIFALEESDPEAFSKIYTQRDKGILEDIDHWVNDLLSLLEDESSPHWHNPFVMEFAENIHPVYTQFLELSGSQQASTETMERLLAEEKALDSEYDSLQHQQTQTIVPKPSQKPFPFVLNTFLTASKSLSENPQAVVIDTPLLALHQRMQLILEGMIPVLLEDIEGVRPHFFHINALERNFALYDDKMRTVIHSEFLEEAEKQQRLEEWRDRRHKDMLSVF